MPQKVFLASYAIRVRAKHDLDYLSFGGIPDGKSFLELLQDFFNGLTKVNANDEATSSLHGILSIDSDQECIWGQLRSGDYGYSSDLVDINTNERTFKRGPEHAEMRPYYFMLYAPAHKDRGILIVQRLGNQGILTVFQKHLQGYLSERDLVLEKSDHVPSEVYDYVNKGGVKEVIFRKFPLPGDKADLLNWNPDEVEEFAEVSLVIKAKKNKSLNSPFLQKRYASLMEIKTKTGETLSDADQMKMVVEYAGARRTVHFDQPGKIAPIIEITDSVKIDSASGNPVYETIHSTAKTLLVGILTEIKEPP